MDEFAIEKAMMIRRRTYLIFVILAVVVAGSAWLKLQIDNASLNAQQATQLGLAGQLNLSMRNYHSHYGSFPPAYVADENGNRMHSWRALIAEMGAIDLRKEEQEAFAQYSFQQPWNTSQNLALLERPAPWMYYDQYGAQDNSTLFVAVVGEDTAFPGTDIRRLGKEVPYSAGIIVEVMHSGVPWTEPRDISVDEFIEIFRRWKKQKTSLWSIFGSPGKGPAVLFADGRVRRLTEDMTEEEVRDIFKVPPDPNAPPPKIWE